MLTWKFTKLANRHRHLKKKSFRQQSNFHYFYWIIFIYFDVCVTLTSILTYLWNGVDVNVIFSMNGVFVCHWRWRFPYPHTSQILSDVPITSWIKHQNAYHQDQLWAVMRCVQRDMTIYGRQDVHGTVSSLNCTYGVYTWRKTRVCLVSSGFHLKMALHYFRTDEMLK